MSEEAVVRQQTADSDGVRFTHESGTGWFFDFESARRGPFRTFADAIAAWHDWRPWSTSE